MICAETKTMTMLNKGFFRPIHKVLFLSLLVLLIFQFSIQSVLAQEDFGGTVGVPESYWSIEGVAIIMGIVFVLILILLFGWHFLSTLHMNKLLRISIYE
ncbi:MAG: hypothetical protein Q7J10_01315, partial [Methanosarcinaceae archaeon]|nr:hypothetical protein [Methanosarcinaceae archaeon]